MRNIETEIQALKEQIAMLEKQQQDGYTVEEDHYESYFVQESHAVLRNIEGEILAIIADEEITRKYLADKDITLADKGAA